MRPTDDASFGRIRFRLAVIADGLWPIANQRNVIVQTVDMAFHRVDTIY